MFSPRAPCCARRVIRLFIDAQLRVARRCARAIWLFADAMPRDARLLMLLICLNAPRCALLIVAFFIFIFFFHVLPRICHITDAAIEAAIDVLRLRRY